MLKIKLAMAIIGISSIHLLRTFIEAGNLGFARRARYTEAGIMWQTIIHIVFIFSAIGIAYVDRLALGTVAHEQTGALTVPRLCMATLLGIETPQLWSAPAAHLVAAGLSRIHP